MKSLWFTLLFLVSSVVSAAEFCFDSNRLVGYYGTSPFTEEAPLNWQSYNERFNLSLGSGTRTSFGVVYSVIGTVKNISGDIAPVTGTAVSSMSGWKFNIESVLVLKSLNKIGNSPRSLYGARGIQESWVFGPNFSNGISYRYNFLLPEMELYGFAPSPYSRTSDVSEASVVRVSCF